MSTTHTSTTPSIYIPYVHYTITEADFKNVFNQLNLGSVSRVDLVNKNNNTLMAFIHFEEWYNTDVAKNLLNTINDPTQTATIMYNDPYYWTLLPNKSTFISNQEALSENLLNTEQLELQHEMILNLQERIIVLENALNASASLVSPPPLIRNNYINNRPQYYTAHNETQMSPLVLPQNTVMSANSNNDSNNEKKQLEPCNYVNLTSISPQYNDSQSLTSSTLFQSYSNTTNMNYQSSDHPFSDSEDTNTSEGSSWTDV